MSADIWLQNIKQLSSLRKTDNYSTISMVDSTGNAPNSTSTYLVHYIFADDVYTNLEQISAKEATWLGIPIFGSDFWDPHRKRNSNSIFDSWDSGRIFFLKFRCLKSQKIGIPICKILNFGNLFAQELTTSYHC